MQAIGRQPQRAPDGTWVHYERHRPEQTTLFRLVQQHAATFVARAEDTAGADRPQFVKDEFDIFLECGILARGFVILHCADCGHDKLVALSYQRRGFLPLVRRQAHGVDSGTRDGCGLVRQSRFRHPLNAAALPVEAIHCSNSRRPHLDRSDRYTV